MTELKMIENELELLDQINHLREQVVESRKERRALDHEGDAESVRLAAETREEARAKVERLATEKAEAESRLTTLNARLDRGDESVQVDDVVMVEKAIERLSRLIKPAKADLARAEAKLKPLLCDDHLANFAADVIETVVDVPVILRKRIENAPQVPHAIVLSQTTPTEGWGTVDVSGYVDVKVIGTSRIDWRAINQAFADTGSKVTATSNGIDIADAMFKIPRLTRPVAAPLTGFAEEIAGNWVHTVATSRVKAEDGIYMTSGDGYAHVLGTRLVSADGGKAEGEIKLALGTSLHFFDRERFKAQVEDVLRSVKRSGGTYTSMGDITSLEITDMEIDHTPNWSGTFYGGLPKTYDVTIRVTAIYEEV